MFMDSRRTSPENTEVAVEQGKDYLRGFCICILFAYSYVSVLHVRNYFVILL